MLYSSLRTLVLYESMVRQERERGNLTSSTSCSRVLQNFGAPWLMDFPHAVLDIQF
jgi:hypothetical protein